MALTPSIKIALGWSVIITTGITGFIAARESVLKNRKTVMETKRRIKDQAQREGEVKYEQIAQSRQSSKTMSS